MNIVFWFLHLLTYIESTLIQKSHFLFALMFSSGAASQIYLSFKYMYSDMWTLPKYIFIYIFRKRQTIQFSFVCSRSVIFFRKGMTCLF